MDIVLNESFLGLTEEATYDIEGGVSSKQVSRVIGDVGAVVAAGCAVAATGGWAAVAAGGACLWALVRND